MGSSAVTERLTQKADQAERQAAAYRKLAEVARDLDDSEIAEVLALIAPHHGHTNGNGSHTGPEKKTEPRGREAIRLIVAERPGIWTMPQLVWQMEERGWFKSRKAVEVAVARMPASSSCTPT